METIEKSVEVLNDLIQINNDRDAGFAHATQDLNINDGDLRMLFRDMREESRDYVQQLGKAINEFGGEPEMGVSTSGAIHRAWLDMKAAFSGHDRKSILEECETGEDAIKKAYKDALDPDSGLLPEFYDLVSSQYQGIIASHNRIKALRDSEG